VELLLCNFEVLDGLYGFHGMALVDIDEGICIKFGIKSSGHRYLTDSLLQLRYLMVPRAVGIVVERSLILEEGAHGLVALG